MVKYVRSANKARISIDRPNIQMFAKEVANKVNLNQFKASSGWLTGFLKTNGIKLKAITGESVLKNISIKYLPPNTTSKVQPIDQGIIRSYKLKYKSYFLRYLIAKIESHLEIDVNLERLDQLQQQLKDVIKHISLKETINWTTSAWNEVTQQTIHNC